ncbi:hypothetical protein SFA35_16515 [Pseudomonas sp. HR96]|uniref:hypothetical protein n=1 Tax=Pseudomonas sp. HR96 TaxID=1027966 RepID=UPI002A74E596|nr:hypothetical protein [Pseudomonas sp. HR96]WPO98245.1 hypothetical protein SFA35_16515 [Pseudomonas sp. HR96]
MDWYRQIAWSEQIESEFERRLARSRGQRSEYLRIQAVTLADQDLSDLAPVAIKLAKRQLELSATGISAAQMWATVAKGCVTLGQFDEAMDAYRHAVRLEGQTPNVRGHHYLDFAWHVVTNSVVALYPEVLAAIEQNLQQRDLIFPANQYRYFAALALIAADSGDRAKASTLAKNALASIETSQGPFWRLPLLGRVKSRADPIRTRLEQLAR